MNIKSLGIFAATLAFATALVSEAAAVAPPYLEDFESEPTCSTSCGATCTLSTTGWLNEPTADDLDWAVDTGGTSSSFTGPSTGYLGSAKYLYIETSTPCNGGAQEAHLISPPLELTNTTNPTAYFFYHLYGGNMGTLHVDISTDGGQTFTNDVVPSLTDDLDAWQLQTVDLTSYAGQTVHLRLRGIVGNGFESDMAIDQFGLYDAASPPEDVAVTVDAPAVSGCGLGQTETVTVTLTNLGPTSVSNVPLELVVDGGTPVVETYAGPLNGFGATDVYTFTATADLSAAGPHTVTVTAGVVNDVDPSNDSDSTFPFNATAINTFPYFEDFEGQSGWTTGGPTTVWDWGFPYDSVIFGAASGVSAWVTNLAGNYPANHDGWVTHACGFDMTGMTNPAIRLAIWYESEFSWDGARLESSIDGGSSWQPVGVFGDPANWYNDGTIAGLPDVEDGWTGRVNTGNGSNGWIIAGHELTGLAGQSNVNLRVRFGSDGTVTDEGFAVDDIYIFDNADGVEVVGMGPAATMDALDPNATDIHLETIRLDAFGAAAKSIDSVVLTQTGTIADSEIADLRLFLDDGDMLFDNQTDTVLGNGTLSSGTITFATTGAVAIGALDSAYLFVEADLTGAAAGATIQVGVANPATDIVENGSAPVSAAGTVQGPVAAVVGAVNSLPYYDDFSGGQPNRASLVTPGTYPTATTAGNTIGTGTATTNDGQTGSSTGTASGPQSPVAPASPPAMAALSYPNGDATAAIDYLFDLSSYAVANDDVWLAFSWNNTNASDNDENNVFLSLDNGATWLLSLHRFDFSAPVPAGWQSELMDLSTLIAGESADYTGQVLLRFQARGNGPLGSDGVLIDDVFVGMAQLMGVERIANTDIPELSTDDLTQVSIGTQSFTYTLRNDGDLPLTIGAITTANDTNVTGVSFGAPQDTTIASQSTTTVQVDFDVTAEGAFSFDVAIANDDPRSGDGTFDFTVAGEGIVPMPDIDIQRPAGTSIASGGTDDAGSVNVGEAQSLSYTIENVGTGDLTVGAATIDNATNVVAAATGGDVTLGAGETDSLDVDFTVEAEGAFSFDLVVASDDADEDPYTITISGTGVGQGTGGGGAGGGGMGGSGGSGTSPTTDSDDDSGCGCTVPGKSGGSMPWAPVLGTLLALGAVARRRRT